MLELKTYSGKEVVKETKFGGPEPTLPWIYPTLTPPPALLRTSDSGSLPLTASGPRCWALPPGS